MSQATSASASSGCELAYKSALGHRPQPSLTNCRKRFPAFLTQSWRRLSLLPMAAQWCEDRVFVRQLKGHDLVMISRYRYNHDSVVQQYKYWQVTVL